MLESGLSVTSDCDPFGGVDAAMCIGSEVDVICPDGTTGDRDVIFLKNMHVGDRHFGIERATAIHYLTTPPS